MSDFGPVKPLCNEKGNSKDTSFENYFKLLKIILLNTLICNMTRNRIKM